MGDVEQRLGPCGRRSRQRQSERAGPERHQVHRQQFGPSHVVLLQRGALPLPAAHGAQGWRGKPVEYVKISLREVLITSVETGGSGGDDRLTENVSLNFAKVKVEYLPQEAKGGQGNMIPFSWDIAANDDEV